MNIHIPSFTEALTVSRSQGHYSEAPELWNGLIGAWAMLQGGGKQVYDLSGYSDHGILTNMDPATDWVASPYGYALAFAGDNDCLTYASRSISGPFSVFVHLKRGGVGTWQGILVTTGGGYVITEFAANNKLYFHAGSPLYSVGAITDTTDWHTVGFTRNAANNGTTYIDGVATSTGAVGANTGGTAMYLASKTGAAEFLNGQIGIAGLWNVELPPNIFSQLHNDPYAPLRLRRRVSAMAPSGLSIPIAMRHYLQMQGAG